jgi:hypothetical protein
MTEEVRFAVDSPLEEAGFELMVPPAIFCATATVSKPVFRTRLAAGAKEIRTLGPTPLSRLREASLYFDPHELS